MRRRTRALYIPTNQSRTIRKTAIRTPATMYVMEFLRKGRDGCILTAPRRPPRMVVRGTGGGFQRPASLEREDNRRGRTGAWRCGGGKGGAVASARPRGRG